MLDLGILVNEGIIPAQLREEIDAAALKSGRSPWELLVARAAVPEARLMEAAARVLGYGFMADLSACEVAPGFLDRVPLEFARRFGVVGIRDNGSVTLVTARVEGFNFIDEVARRLGVPLKVALAPAAQVESLIGRAFQERSTTTARAVDALGDVEDIDIRNLDIPRSEDLIDDLNKAPLIKMLNAILARAIKERASDVHVHPYENVLKIRYRIDGILYDMLELPVQFTESVISRVKVISGLDIAERRAPQDGRTTLRFADREVDVRVSVVPTSNGERAVMRLLDKGTELFALEQLGMHPEVFDLYARLIRLSHGIIFVTGPTGSGKTTTLYAALSRINSSEKNIITIEDPIEYQLEGISQIQVNERKNVTFANGLRSVLRQDPDILMVGEVRDAETASMAIQSALTGHLVFSTLHTNDAPSAATRLMDMGVEPYLIASTVIGVMGQRLVRRICGACRESYVPDPKLLADMQIDPALLPDGRVSRGRGCAQCRNTGYRGRMGLFELFIVTARVKQQIMDRQNASQIKREAVTGEQHMLTMRMDGITKILRGETTIEEVMAHTHIEDL
ncbi:MAG: ATPase, T2SS/T4P/T4SS family [Planctomycetota bacterium]